MAIFNSFLYVYQRVPRNGDFPYVKLTLGLSQRGSVGFVGNSQLPVSDLYDWAENSNLVGGFNPSEKY